MIKEIDILSQILGEQLGNIDFMEARELQT